VVAAAQRRQRLLDGGDDLDLVELLAGERDDSLALLHEPDERCLAVVLGYLDDVVHLVAVQPRSIGDIYEIPLPGLQLLDPQQLPAFRGTVLSSGWNSSTLVATATTPASPWLLRGTDPRNSVA
jgi:hypothetical protein